MVPAAPFRTCVACRATRPQGEFIRVTRVPMDGVLLTPPHATSFPKGRSAYVCASPECVNQGLKPRKGRAPLSSALRIQIAPSVETQLRAIMGAT